MEVIYLNKLKTFESFLKKLSNTHNGDIIFLNIEVFSGNQNDYNKIIEMNKMIDYLKKNGQSYYYRTPACYPSEDLMTFNDFIELEKINEKLQKIIKNNKYDNAHIIRLVETYIGKTMRVLYEEVDSHSLLNIAQSIKFKLGNCRHLNYLNYYLLTRNSIMCLKASNKLLESSHAYLIVYLKEQRKWTCADATWDAQDISMETGSYWSFLSYQDITQYDSDGHHIVSDKNLIDLDTISFDPNEIYEMDKKIGFIINEDKDFYTGAFFPYFLEYYFNKNKEEAAIIKTSDNIKKAEFLLDKWSKIFNLEGKTPNYYVSMILSNMISKDNFCKAIFHYLDDKNKDSSNIIVSVRDIIDEKEEFGYFVHSHTDRTFHKYNREELIAQFGKKIKTINSNAGKSSIYGISANEIEPSNQKILKGGKLSKSLI